MDQKSQLMQFSVGFVVINDCGEVIKVDLNGRFFLQMFSQTNSDPRHPSL